MKGTRSGRPQRAAPARSWRAAPARHLLAASARPRLAAVLVGCAILVVALGAVFARQSTSNPFDSAVDSPVISWFAGHQGLAQWLALPGTTISAAALTVIIVVACLLSGRLTGALLAAAAVPVAVGLCEVLIKPLVHRTYIGQIVYPSGHMATVSALAATVTVLLLAPPRPVLTRPLRVLILTVAYLAVAAVIVGVIAVRFHYFTDTVAGAAVGTGTVCGLALVLDLIPAAWPSRIPRRSAAT
jgi:membrane-associated phospholipid phosphatase